MWNISPHLNLDHELLSYVPRERDINPLLSCFIPIVVLLLFSHLTPLSLHPFNLQIHRDHDEVRRPPSAGFSPTRAIRHRERMSSTIQAMLRQMLSSKLGVLRTIRGIPGALS
jgi:hypothetical protein